MCCGKREADQLCNKHIQLVSGQKTALTCNLLTDWKAQCFTLLQKLRNICVVFLLLCSTNFNISHIMFILVCFKCCVNLLFSLEMSHQAD